MEHSQKCECFFFIPPTIPPLQKSPRLQLFNENHDTNRIYSQLKNKQDNFVQHLLFYTLPGVPTIYYGQENLLSEIRHLASVRLDCDALREGGYQQEFVHSQQFAFWRTHQNGDALVLINQQDTPVQFEIDLHKHLAHAQQVNT